MGTNIFKLNAENNYQIVDYIKSDLEVNAETEAAIRSKYSVSDELKLHRLNSVTPGNSDFAAYSTFAEDCRAQGNAKKNANAAKLATLKQVTIGEGNSSVIIFVKG